MNTPTADVYRALQQAGALTIEELARSCRCSKTEARRALHRLEEEGCIALTVREEPE